MAIRRLLVLIADSFPTHRADVAVLFGKELPRHGIVCDLIAQRALESAEEEISWAPGQAFLCRRTGNRFRDQLAALWHDFRTLWKADARNYDAIQVRDKVFAGILGLVRARRGGLPFFFWMSFPMSESFLELARREGRSLGIARWAFFAVKGHLGKRFLYRFLLPRCDHIFVQSEQMANDLARQGIRRDRMTPVPMGVDLDRVGHVEDGDASITRALAGRRVIAYLGTLDRTRRIDFLFEVLAEVRRKVPNAVLLLVGDAPEAADRAWLEAMAIELNVDDAIVWTGWVPTTVAWAYVRQADVGVSLFPRGELLDSASPTKVVEYLALGLPVVANDQPDQHDVLTQSRAGLSVAMNVSDFSDAVVTILNDSRLAAAMREAGPPYVKARRSYSLIGEQVAGVYRKRWLAELGGRVD